MDQQATQKILMDTGSSISKQLGLRSVIVAGAIAGTIKSDGNNVTCIAMAEGETIDIHRIVTKLLHLTLDADGLAEYGRFLIKMAYETKDKPETQSSNGHHGPRVRGGK